MRMPAYQPCLRRLRSRRGWFRAGVAALSVILVSAAPPPQAVLVVPIEVKDVAPVQTFPGQVQAIRSVTVVARVSAYVEKVAFQEGSTVKAGRLLFQLQQGPYQAAVEQAQGALAQAQAVLSNAQLNLERDTRVGNLAISAQQIQQDTAARDEASAQVTSARGNLENAAINLSYCTVAAPIDGRIGKALYTMGNLVSPTSGPLPTIVQMDPIRIAFSVADAQFVAVQQASNLSREQLINSVTLDVQLSNGSNYAHPGKIEFVNNQVDTAIGTLTVWGTFPNPDGLLVPGAYATVAVHQTNPEQRPVVPVQAVQNEQQGEFVLLVGADNKVEQRKITTGRQIDQDYIVASGLTGGERVITEGVQKVHPGEVVNPSMATTGSNSTSQSGGLPSPAGSTSSSGSPNDGAEA